MTIGPLARYKVMRDRAMKELGIAYFIPDLDVFKLSLGDSVSAGDGLTFEKELIHVGNFIKDDKKNGSVRFTVTEPVLHHWKNTTELMLANGHSIPLPKGHTFDPELNRGELKSVRVGPNSRKQLALFGKIKFRDQEAAKLAKTCGTSVFVTPDFTDGNHNTYYRPIRHVALTDYPVIPNLDKFEAIAAAYDPGAISTMDYGSNKTSALLPIAQMLGVPQPEDMSDAQLTEAIMGIFQIMKDMVDGNEESIIDRGTTTMTKLPSSFAASFGNMLKGNRTLALESLVRGGHILPAVKDDLCKQFCTDETIALSLENLPLEDEAAMKRFSEDTVFNALVNALKKNKAMAYNEKTGMQLPDSVALSHDGDNQDTSEDNVLTRQADAIRKNAQEYSSLMR